MTARVWLKMLACAAMMAVPAASQKPATTMIAPVPAAKPETVSGPVAQRPDARPDLTAADVGTWLDGFLPNALRQGKIAGAQVSIVKDGRILFEKGYGYADVATRKPMDADRDLMRIGSTTKLLTWTAVLQLAEAGRIDLDADVNRYLDFKVGPNRGRPVTMNDLMTHTAGLEEGLKDVLATDPRYLQTTEHYLKTHLRPFLFAPGTLPAYSNYGAALAGYIVQRVSGEPFEQYVQRHILKPLAMNRTTLVQPLPAGLATSVAQGYRQSDGPPSKFELVETAPAGSGSTTAADMANFMIAQLQGGRFGGGRIFGPTAARFIRTPEPAPRPGFDAMAHGFFWGHRNGRLVIGHGGDTMVFHSDLNMLPDENVGIFVSFNSRGERDAVYGVRERLFELFMDRYFPAPEPIDPPAIASAATDANRLAGRYESSRRVETGFISLFYLIQQEQVVPHQDGTIGLASIEGKSFREVAPGLWREVHGTRQLAVTTTGGRRTIVDSQNPIAALQAVPFSRNSGLFLLVTGLSLVVVLVTVLAWPIATWLRRRHGLIPVATGRVARLRTFARIAALADLVYLAAWYAILAPILSTVLDGYNEALDGTVRMMQVASIVPVAAAIVGLWNAYAAFRAPVGWSARLRTVVVALALLGILWAAWMGRLIGWNVNY